MSIVYGFVRQSNGHIEVHSKEGEGTTVLLYLQRATDVAQHDGMSEAAKIQSHGQGQLILVVEDDSDVRELVVALLSGLGYRVRQAETAELALQLIKDGLEIDLLFSDVVLPGEMNGPDLVAAVLEMSPELRYLFMSGYTQHAGASAMLLDESTNLLHKPFSRTELASRIQQTLDQPLPRRPGLRLVQS